MSNEYKDWEMENEALYQKGYKDGYAAAQAKIKELYEIIDALRDYNDQLLSEIQSIRGYI